MVVLNDKTAEVYIAIRAILRDFYTKAWNNIVKNRGIDLDAKNNRYLQNALSYMRDVSEHPEKYFSRATTEEDWIRRAGIKYGMHAVDDPADIVYNKVLPCLTTENIAHEYRDFCKLVMNWEYSRTDLDYHAKRVSIKQ